MTETIRKEIFVPDAVDEVWMALTDKDSLADWMYPNDFEPRVGHRFTFRVPANPQAGFDGIVRCEVLECSAPSALAYSWEGGPVVGTTVRYELKPDGDGTRIVFEHSGFDVSQPWGTQALKGAEFGWNKMLEALKGVVARGSSGR